MRQAQARQLYDNFRMTSLAILRDNVSLSFQDQVLASPDFDIKRNLLFIFHDPPDLYIPPGATSNLVSAHNIQAVDGVTQYIAWALDNGFGVVDVNVPEYITPVHSDTAVSYASAETDAARMEGEKLVRYLYTNYIETADASSIVLMGVGNAFHAITKPLGEIYQHIHGVIGFIGGNPVRPAPSDTWVSSWYRQNSLVYVAETHGLWQKPGKLSKRYGGVRRTKGNTGNEIMLINQEEAEDWILRHVEDEDATEDESDEARLPQAAAPEGVQPSRWPVDSGASQSDGASRGTPASSRIGDMPVGLEERRY